MTDVLVLDTAKGHLDDIYVYTYENWGAEQANCYLDALYEMFDRIAERDVPWRRIPAEFELGVAGYFVPCGSHFIYWRELSSDELGIFAVLHQRMDLGNRLREVTGP